MVGRWVLLWLWRRGGRANGGENLHLHHSLHSVQTQDYVLSLNGGYACDFERIRLVGIALFL